MSARLPCLTLLSALFISGCQTPTEYQKPDSDTLSTALQQIENQQYQSAKTTFEVALNSDSELASQQALAGLCLLHLQNQNIELATKTLDAFYQRALRKPQGNTSLKLLGLSLKLNLENSLHLTLEREARVAAETKQQTLYDETQALQRALQKLRQLSLQ